MMHLSAVVSVCLGASLTSFAGALGCFISGRKRAGVALMAIGWLLDLAVVVLNGVVSGEPPLGNMYHVMTVLPLCFAPIYALLRWRDGMSWLQAHIAAAGMVALVGAMCMDRDVHWQRAAVLQSWWFVPHVLSYLLSYAMAAVGFALIVTRLARGRPAADPAFDGYGVAARRVVRYAMPFMTFGLLSGALWADDAWGVYWSWDPKETWSLITWLLYMSYLHAWRDERWRKRSDWIQVAAFGALVVTFLVVNLVPKLAKSLHSYA